MAFYSSKCEECSERIRRVVKEIKYKDGNGTYTIKYYECENVGCDIAYKTVKKPKTKKETNFTYHSRGEKKNG